MLWINTAPFQHPLVADLAWAIASPPLLLPQALGNAHIMDEQWHLHQWELHKDWLQTLDAQPQELLHFMADHHHPLLGKRFESLLRFWFSHSPHFQLIDAGMVWHRHGNTIGESDFLIQPADQEEPWHIEVACKYYIARENSPKWQAWWGPNGKDRLDVKMQTMQRQVASMQTPEALKYLHNKGLPAPLRKAIIKGYFFVPFHLLGRHASPDFAHHRHEGGWYVKLSQAHVFADDYPQWLLLPKNRWMSPYAAPKFEATPLTGKEMVALSTHYLIERKRAPLVVQVKEDEMWWKEISRGFIVAD